MNILLLGSGGRECAIARKLSESTQTSKLYIAPGNAGTKEYGENVNLKISDFEEVKLFCLKNNIQILFPGGEDTLVMGIYDFFKNDETLQHIIIVGPSQAGAQLEGSKAFAKKFMQRHHIPTAAYQEFDAHNFEDGLMYLEQHSTPIVLKADGLAAGKGVVITEDIEEAKQVFTAMIQDAQFGDAGKKVVVEQFLNGIELSVFLMTDGENFVVLPEAKDYKRIGEGDTGLNTGGMGAVSPVPFFKEDGFMEKVIEQIAKPTVAGLAAENIVYNGFIFLGLIKVNNEPFVIEYNCRMGDPETEVVMPRLENDLTELILKMESKSLNQITIKHNEEAAVTVMLVSGGYPEHYEKYKTINGINDIQNSIIFHAGTTEKEGQVLTNGGRVIAITSYGKNLKDALNKSYKNADIINFEGMYFRKDIGHEFI